MERLQNRPTAYIGLKQEDGSIQNWGLNINPTWWLHHDENSIMAIWFNHD
jgi:hypothetical protein